MRSPLGPSSLPWMCLTAVALVACWESTRPDPPVEPECPDEEWLGDGLDNDCDGLVDECPEGCSVRLWPWEGCECLPGSWRYCGTADFGLWGIEHCHDFGIWQGPCVEAASVPAACEDIDDGYSPAALLCCVEQGACCHDEWDLDADGDTFESLGGCPDVDPSICPDAPPCLETPTEEICGDLRDNDCDGRTDETCEGWPCTLVLTDEICANGLDDDCDGRIDEGCAG